MATHKCKFQHFPKFENGKIARTLLSACTRLDRLSFIRTARRIERDKTSVKIPHGLRGKVDLSE